MIRISFIYVATSFVPAFIGVRRLRQLNAGQRALCGWVVLSALLNAIQSYLSNRGQSTAWMTIVAYPIFAVVALETLGRLSDTAWYLAACRVFALIYVVAWAVVYRFLEDNRWFSGYAGPLLWLTLTLAAAALIMVRFTRDSHTSFAEPAVLSAVATLVSYTPVVALEPASKALYAAHPDLVIVLWESRAVLMIIGVVLYTRALQWPFRRPS